MKKHFTLSLIFVLSISYSTAQQWIKSLDIAQKLALVQNKMVLMVWEESTYYDYPVIVQDDKGRFIMINNLFLDEDISPLIWKNFVPVVVNENKYADLYLKIKGKRSQRYIDKFNDNSIKILDANGNILNVKLVEEQFQNITKLIKKYALNTAMINLELNNYIKEKNFYSAYFLASKYLDFALYANENVRSEIIDLSNIYLNEATEFVEQDQMEGKASLLQRCELLKIQENLVLKRPKKVLRQLKRLDLDNSVNSNEAFVAFLYYTAHRALGDDDEAEKWKTKVSSLNLKKAKLIINLNI